MGENRKWLLPIRQPGLYENKETATHRKHFLQTTLKQQYEMYADNEKKVFLAAHEGSFPLRQVAPVQSPQRMPDLHRQRPILPVQALFPAAPVVLNSRYRLDTGQTLDT